MDINDEIIHNVHAFKCLSAFLNHMRACTFDIAAPTFGLCHCVHGRMADVCSDFQICIFPFSSLDAKAKEKVHLA